MENPEDMKALFIIVNTGFAESVMEIAREVGVLGATIFSARGISRRREIVMGIPVEADKEMVLAVTGKETSEKAMAAIKEKAGIKTPAHSVCFTMPVDKIVGINISSPPSAG